MDALRRRRRDRRPLDRHADRRALIVRRDQLARRILEERTQRDAQDAGRLVAPPEAPVLRLHLAEVLETV